MCFFCKVRAHFPPIWVPIKRNKQPFIMNAYNDSLSDKEVQNITNNSKWTDFTWSVIGQHRWTAHCLHPGQFKVAGKIWTDGQYAILSLAGSQNLCQTIILILVVYLLCFPDGWQACHSISWDLGAKVSLFMHEWTELVMFQEQKWLLPHTLRNAKWFNYKFFFFVILYKTPLFIIQLQSRHLLSGIE